jgi:segregation and condensation protein B
MTLDAKIEAILFFKGEPTSIQSLSKILGIPEFMIMEELVVLEGKLIERGLSLVRSDGDVALVTAEGVSEIIETLSKEELSRDLSKASLETLAIILYRGPITRSEIEYIRGVQSSFIIRSLSIRGLIDRIENQNDQRGFLYKPTFDLLRHLGIDSLDKMPEYGVIHEKLTSIAKDTEVSSTVDKSTEPEV